MKNPAFSKFKLSAFGGFVLWVVQILPANSWGAVLIQDDFNRTGSLNGSTTTTGGLTWTADANLTTDGSSALLGNAGFLPFAPTSGNVYSLDVVMKYNGSAQVWGAFGFATTTLLSKGNFATSAAAAPWMLSAYWGNSIDTWAGAGTTNMVTSSGYSFDRNVFNLFTIKLDTSKAAWSASFYVNNTLVSSYTYATNPSIVAIAIGNQNSSSTSAFSVDSLTLSVVPEPSVVALAVFGVGFIALRLRKKSRLS